MVDTIHKQILTDPEGNPVSVVIPYREWQRIEARLGELDQTGVSGAGSQPRPLGLARGEFTIPEAFFEPLPDGLLDAFEGKSP